MTEPKNQLLININEQVGPKNYGALHYAAMYHNNPQLFNLLIEHGANANLCDADGKSAAQHAAKFSAFSHSFTQELIMKEYHTALLHNSELPSASL